jgi:hypothetical protein
MGIFLGPSNRVIDKIREDFEFDSRQLDAAPQYMNSPNCRKNITTNTIKYNRPTNRNTKDPPNDQIIEYSTLSTIKNGKSMPISLMPLYHHVK